jgi:quercetin dioxygenase-like cupin family protein
MKEPEIQIGCVSNIYIRMMNFKNAGDVEHGHTHEFDHTSFLTRGSVRLTVDGIVKEFTAPHMILIAKNKEHEVVALEDDTIVCCIHGLRDNDSGDILDPDQIPYDENPKLLNHRLDL